MINSQLRGSSHTHTFTAEDVAKSDFHRLDGEMEFNHADFSESSSDKKNTSEVVINLAARMEEHDRKSGHDYDLEDL